MPRKRPAIAFRGEAITIACTDKERSLHFYQGILGAIRDPRDEGYGCPWLRLGALTICLLPNAVEPCPVKFPEHAGTMLWLETDDLNAAREHLVANGVPVIAWHDGESMIVTDPDGLLIEIWPVANDSG